MTNHMYRSNRTPETENSTAMHFGSDAAACVSGARGGGGVNDRPSIL